MQKIIPFFTPYNCADGYLSNFYNAPMVIDGVSYHCVEQYMMAQKADTFANNESLKKEIMNCPYPARIKRLGREVQNFDADVWYTKSIDVVTKAVREKFKQNDHLCQRLFDTKDATLVEASPFDKLWGVGCNIKNATDPANWKGQNRLGKILMQVRDELSSET